MEKKKIILTKGEIAELSYIKGSKNYFIKFVINFIYLSVILMDMMNYFR